ncbi:MAG: sporulation protein [Ruminiclostridium sp.]|nr:sporulation protein [Ruminiclostridium sp.]MBQ9932252.1 sporulation protein [Ruminiclostridium sp.]
MKQTGQTLGSGIVLLGVAALLFSFPSQSAEAARKGVCLCLDLIIPSLFPFFVLSSLVISTGLAGWLARPLARTMRAMFGVGSAGASLLVLGVVGGYPAGARTLAQMTALGDLSLREARQLYLFCNNCGPAFFIGVVGGELFGSREVGFLLWGTHLLAALCIGLFCRAPQPRPVCSPTVTTSPLSVQLPEAVTGAFHATLNVCAYVVLFSVLTGLLSCVRVLPEAPLPRALCVGLLEISTGITTLGEAVSSPAALPLAAFLLGWGGCSVHCQTLPFWRELGLPAGPYLLAKLCQGVLAAGLTLLLTHLFPLTLPVMATEEVITPVSLLGQEMTALWALAGCCALLTKKGGKGRKNTV